VVGKRAWPEKVEKHIRKHDGCKTHQENQRQGFFRLFHESG
jgi:hypothetical protein